MKFRDIFLTANGNLFKSKLRTFLTSSAVFIGALTLMLTTGVGYGLRTYVEEQIQAAGADDALIILAMAENVGPASNEEAVEYKPDQQSGGSGFTSLPTVSQEAIDEIGNIDGIIEINPLYATEVEYIGRGENKFKANLTQGLENLTIPLKAGRNVHANSESYEITLAPAFVEPLGFSSDEEALDQPIDVAYKDANGEIFTLQATIVGVQEKTLIQGNSMSTSISLARDAHQRATAGLPEAQSSNFPGASARYDTTISEDRLDQIQKEISDKGLMAQTLDDQLGIINSIIDGIITFLNIFAAIALAAASFGIVNTLLMAVQERTREIGLMKALGMGRKKIFLLFSLEAILIGLWSSLLALVAANIIGRAGSNVASNTILKDFEGLELFSFPVLPMLGIISLIMAIAFLASTLPARRASKLNPIDALRYE